MRTLHGVLERDYPTTLRRLHRFYEVLRNLRYEGKATLGKNLAEAGELVRCFRRDIRRHMRKEEKAFFPYLRAHIPRLEPVMCLLASEHEDLRTCLDGLEGSLRRRAVGAVLENGTYLLCLLRSHLGCETRSVYRTAERELRAEEKRTLMQRLMKI